MSINPPIQLTGQMSLSDGREADRLLRLSFIVKLRRAAIILISLICPITIWLVLSSTNLAQLSISDRIVIAICLLFPLAVIGQYSRMRQQWRRSWETKQGWFYPIETTIREGGITSKAEHAHAEYDWEFFTNYRATDRVIVLWGPRGNLFFARSRFACDTDWTKFSEFVAQRFPRRK